MQYSVRLSESNPWSAVVCFASFDTSVLQTTANRMLQTLVAVPFRLKRKTSILDAPVDSLKLQAQVAIQCKMQTKDLHLLQ